MSSPRSPSTGFPPRAPGSWNDTGETGPATGKKRSLFAGKTSGGSLKYSPSIPSRAPNTLCCGLGRASGSVGEGAGEEVGQGERLVDVRYSDMSRDLAKKEQYGERQGVTRCFWPLIT